MVVVMVTVVMVTVVMVTVVVPDSPFYKVTCVPCVVL